MKGAWLRSTGLPPKEYVCRHERCQQHVTSGEGWPFLMDEQYEIWFIYICPACLKPTFFDHYGNTIP